MMFAGWVNRHQFGRDRVPPGRTACSRSDSADGVFASPTLNVDDLPEKRPPRRQPVVSVRELPFTFATRALRAVEGVPAGRNLILHPTALEAPVNCTEHRPPSRHGRSRSRENAGVRQNAPHCFIINARFIRSVPRWYAASALSFNLCAIACSTISLSK